MTALKLVNNTSLRSEKNLCYVNTELQLLYSIPDVNQFFTSKKYRESYEQRLPVCDEISRIFGTGGQIQASAAELRRLVGVFHGRSDICNGIQQDIVEFHTLLLRSIEVELERVGYQQLSFLIKFRGKEKTTKAFLHTRDGCCPKGHMVRTENELFQVIKIEVPPTHKMMSINDLINNKFGKKNEIVQMKCSDCCEHQGLCPQTGKCKLLEGSSKIKLVSTPDILYVQLLRFDGYQNHKITTKITPENILVLPNNDKYKLVSVGNHLGTLINNGHYQAVVKTATNWLKVDDTNITRTTLPQEITENNYIFVYKKFSTTKPFVATKDWEEVLENQPIPPGLKVQLDITTGKKFAKLDDDQTNNHDTVTKTKKESADNEIKIIKDKGVKTVSKEDPAEKSSKLKEKQIVVEKVNK